MSRLTLFREKLHLTQEELAEKSRISVRTIQRIEAGTLPKGFTLKSLAKALNINESDLIENEQIEAKNDINWLKMINLSSLFFTFLPPLNIILPLILMALKKQFNPLTKQMVSIQILLTILSVIIFMLSAIMGKWFGLGNRFILIVMILLVLANILIIIRNAVSLDKTQTLYFRLGFSLI
jgi:transcriptional regulator with XRE-family HTH domain